MLSGRSRCAPTMPATQLLTMLSSLQVLQVAVVRRALVLAPSHLQVGWCILFADNGGWKKRWGQAGGG